MDIWFKTGANRRRSWSIASNDIQYFWTNTCTFIAGRISLKSLFGRNEQFYPWCCWICRILSRTLVPVNIDKCLQRKIFVWYYDLLVINALKKQYSFFHAIEKILVVAHPCKNSQTCPQNIEVTTDTFWEISTSFCHKVPHELSNLLDSNCQSKYQCCGGSLQSSHQKNIRFDCKTNKKQWIKK